MKPYDVIIIGGGSAGYAAARTAQEAGLKVAVIEGGRQVGGLCILRGCMPTKAILESAHRLKAIREAREFGIQVPGPARADWSAIMRRKNRLIADFADYRQSQLSSGRFDFFRATAEFIDGETIRLKPVGKFDQKIPETLKAKYFIIATGSEVQMLDIPGLKEVGFLTSDDALERSTPFDSLVVLGGGPIAIELADYYLHLGVKVTVVQRSPHILKGQDNDVAEVVEDAFRACGGKLFTDTRLMKVQRHGSRKEVLFEHQGALQSVRAQEILYALGRRPVTRPLHLDRAGVKIGNSTIATNRAMRTNKKNIYAVGDVAGPYEVVHLAILQGETAARNIIRELQAARKKGKKTAVKSKPEKMDYRLKMEIVFCSPEVASVGMTEKEAAEENRKVMVARYPFDDHGKSMIMGATRGFVKLIADPQSGEILGAQIVGPHASDLIHEFVVAMHYRSTVQDFMKIPHYHPTLAEIVTYPAEELAEKVV